MSKQPDNTYLKVIGACENNLRNINIQIPHNSFTVITGVSGSGKSSLAYNVIYRESQRRFLESFSTHTRQYISKLEKPDVQSIEGLQPALAINQKATVSNPRSTVGTISGVYDYLRLLYARTGKQHCSNCGTVIGKESEKCSSCATKSPRLLSKLFSFNSEYGACPDCKGLGVQEHIDINKLIADENLSLREGALVPTTPNGYIVYSQVRVDELNRVCQKHDFSVDVPWNELTEEQKHVIMYGSESVKILFGKHSLESRLKWKGITALPREESYYKGMIPIMEEILRRDRNDNILRFASSYTCDSCNGTRLRKDARRVTVDGKNICELSDMPISELHQYLKNLYNNISDNEVVEAIIEPAEGRLKYLELLGLGYLKLNRESTTLSGGESQRIRLASQVGSGLQGILYILDEPSISLHPRDTKKLLKVLNALRDNGNTLLVVEHDEETILASDYLIDIGPGAGLSGGKVMFEGKTVDFFKNTNNHSKNITSGLYSSDKRTDIPQSVRKGIGTITIKGGKKNNLKNINVEFKMGCFNVVSGVSGAGKSSLVHDVLGNTLRNNNNNTCDSISSTINISRIIEIDQSPIGRTPRSNPATYTDLFDHIRALFAKQPESTARGYKKGRFSFNNKGGRCEHCEGAGYLELGMHFLGNVDVVCEHCNGSRYNTETLDIKLNNLTISDVLDLSINEASNFFSDEPKITRILDQLIKLDVGYLKLGQSSTTLSGGEAQRVKLASELYKSSKGHNLYILDEPSSGLHKADIQHMLQALNDIVEKGNTVVVIEHDADIIIQAYHVIDLGPEGGDNGGNLVFMGTPFDLQYCNYSYTGVALSEYLENNTPTTVKRKSVPETDISFKGVTTNNLKNIDVVIPLNKITVITGVSGSGKSSLAFDTIYSESRNRFTESLSSYARRMMSKIKKPEIEPCTGLTPAIAIRQSRFGNNPRSTVGTITEIYDLYRLLFSRFGKDNNGNSTQLPASMFSFNNLEATCNHCKGLGIIISADPEKFITDPQNAIIQGAMTGTNPGSFFGDLNGQYVNTLIQVGNELSIDYSKPWVELSEQAKRIALFGTSDKEYEVEWNFKRGNRTGTHKLVTTWKGFINYLTEDYNLKKNGKRGEAFKPIITEFNCPSCDGSRYNDEIINVKFGGMNITQLSSLSIHNALDLFKSVATKLNETDAKNIGNIQNLIISKLQQLDLIGIGYLSINRATSTLSGGEAQRLRIASQLVSNLCGLTYVLDEPTIGLHSYDTNKLLKVIDNLKNNGNTVILVEHDPDVIRCADNIIDIGPGAGVNGGEIIGIGNLKQLLSNSKSITGQYLNKNIEYISKNRNINDYAINISGANANNLKNVNVNIPTNCITVITGVSGTGKSSLVFDVITDSYKAVAPVNCKSASFNNIESITVMDQQRIGTSPLSTPATYIGLFDLIRNEFSKSKDAISQGFKKSHFSFNNKEGRCPVCRGMGSVKVSLDFLSDIWVQCDTCHGNRFKDDILYIKINDKNIIDVLNMDVDDALIFFTLNSDINKSLQVLSSVGLGYLKLGQPTNTLSGGETQRLKLASELIVEKPGNCLYIFDEPSTGLHMKDVNNLILVFNKLIDEGNTVVVVEHNLDIIRSSHWIIDLGPEGGDKGGNVVYSGRVDDIKKCNSSLTGKALSFADK